MTKRTIKIASATDNCRVWDEGGWSLNTTGADITVGYVGAANNKYGGGNRFLELLIPKNSDINSALITFYCRTARTNDNVNSRFTGEKTGNATAFSTLADFQTRRGTIVGGANDNFITTAQVDWDNLDDGIVGDPYESPELKTIIQEIVDIEAIKNLNIFWDDFDNRSTSAALTIRSMYSRTGSSSLQPSICIDFTPPYKVWPGINIAMLALK